MSKIWKIYLSGEIHTEWRKDLINRSRRAKLPVEYFSPVTDHPASDSCGADILGSEPDKFWYDHKGAKLNMIRNKVLIGEADLVIIRFGEKYRQWNAAYDAGYAVALGKPIVVLHPKEFIHALKEIDSAAHAVCETDKELFGVVKYLIKGKLK